ncbi:MAG: HAMP domain-containing histidine kinase [Asticcacaulis sp.]|nr:HAMP domain-containing histidine kinase [Asticcacaulis sp.]
MEKAHDGQRLALLVIRDETDARRMERMRADFLANASHELRTPLASITGFIETLRGPARDDEQARDRFLTIMGAQADRMGRLIADLLSLSRIEMSEHVPPAGEADLALAVRDVVDSLSVLAQQKGIRLRIDAPRPGLFPIIGDRDQILQVVQNLTDNALKYAPQGSEVSITVCFDVTLPQAMSLNDKQAAKLVLLRPDRNVHEYYARVTVRDEGPGIKGNFCHAWPSDSIASKARRAATSWAPAWGWPSSSTSSTAIAADWWSKVRGRSRPMKMIFLSVTVR